MSPSIGGIILCGGRSTRMGASKELLPFGSETMLERVVRLLSEVVSPIVVVAAADQTLPALRADVLVVRDEQAERGPLEGLRAGLKALPESARAAYVTSCDVPLLVPDFVRRMIELLGDHEIVVPVADGFEHSLSAVYRRSVLMQVESLLAEGELRMTGILKRAHTLRVPAAEWVDLDPRSLSLRNLNTVEEYEAALRDAGLM